MTSDSRSADRKDIDSMTREFLAKGGKIVQCPPGSSDSVVYKKTSFRRRGAPNAAATAEAKPAEPESPASDTPASDTAKE
ncbi:hypothetical protein [Azospirillum soli]|uniref:hypothetical protein n=1 Tax=Azospirillum soli TaxID=1304799 RepID=UPI001AE9EDA9|nr:hypothetical protein [Azospirillum soli]MBP2313047.1 hypothetical protein [Azospirillum soli]